MSRINRSPVAIWLLTGVAMIMIQVLLGGITRLTGSGLSITEWKPLLGVIPPMNEADWQAAFDQYKQIGQYKHINFDFSLSDFKFIYFWEWFHRVWARFMGVVFAIGFVYFLIRKQIKKEMIVPMILLFVLGGLQGAIGWIMVKSGLNENDVSVNHIRLSFHFIAALGLLVYVFWFAAGLITPATQQIRNKSLQKFLHLILTVLVIQLFYGAFMAGLKAGTAAPTWPSINGMAIPSGMSSGKQWLFSNMITVQFIHRLIAYILTIMVVYWWWKSRSIQASGWFAAARNLPLVLVFLQVLLGIFTVVYSPQPQLLLWFGVAHQFVAMLLLVSLVWNRKLVVRF